MKCPVCKDVDLVMSERQGVEIDYCPSCRGVWLDRGELDKIIEKSSTYQSNNHSNYFKNDDRNSYNKQNNHQQYNSYDNRQQAPYKKKKEGFLSEIFDFDF
ncbi:MULTISPECIES: zf-TFIIB domain-containing protein [Aliarcobacter]|jgi:Zn-finger nucleic acid-binding protein|uniref:Zf-TFIIB domain-containing protein n=1 Tax=Aliarcobacter cryaerophilus TaxID=28198 RepID=A0AA46S1U9_9BACT|nr:zf-TFIIB domain-containing protein [Aliarcobacter cryaerophilus]MCD8541157.1 zf-TFIIB domain-containing protein [Aliarcobacter cryaerophilus]MCT7508288.1 zf-TFIIB domain-containing protein [Aliarcobacter cryaerophilus]MCT7520010.1 zf-TFIIB domain-containing protein [Aliarcobacter cryaerophilus]MCT7533351.1 zf-TFIIB domain-containing protein [Aliarcobacter cryaerophilus]UYF43759.1 zf-TFIIB domain-containing protein [Aliarcobacter cryaerophilus]